MAKLKATFSLSSITVPGGSPAVASILLRAKHSNGDVAGETMLPPDGSVTEAVFEVEPGEYTVEATALDTNGSAVGATSSQNATVLADEARMVPGSLSLTQV